MNRNEELDARIARWLAESAPSEAPPTMLDDTLARSATTPQRGARGWVWPVARILGAAAILAVAVVVGFGAGRFINPGVGQDVASPMPTPSSSSAASAQPTAAGTPLASATAAPTPPASPTADPDAPLLSFTQGCEVTPPVVVPTTTILGDGRVVWQLAQVGDPYQYRVRRLSEAGLGSVRARIAATSVLGVDGDYRPERRAGTGELPGHGFCLFTFEHRDRDVDATVTSVSWFGDEEEGAYYEPSPERRELDAFAQQLRDPESWLDAADWSDPSSSAYVAASFLVVTSPDAFDASGPDLADVSWPFDAPPSSYGEPAGVDGRLRCDVATRAAIEAYVAGRAQPGGEPIDIAAPSTTLFIREDGIWHSVTLWSLPPAATVGCDAVS